jgi:hypothetical protein
MELLPNDDPNVRRVLVGIPLKGHTPPSSYHDRMLMAYYLGGKELDQKHRKEVPRYEFIWISTGEIFVPFAREMLAEASLRYDCDYLFMVDDDMMAPVDLFYKLVKHDADIVAPLAFTRNPPHRPVMFKTVEGYDKVIGKSYFINTPVFNYPRDKFVECDAVGFGSVLIKTEIFKKMAKPYFMGSTGTGEDIHFCLAAKKLGYKVFMDTAVKLGHLSSPIVVTEEYSDSFNKMSQEEKDKFFGSYTKYQNDDMVKPI